MAICLVSGATGYIGSVLVKRLLTLNHLVIALVRPSSSLELLPENHPNLVIASCTIENDSIQNIFRDFKISIVFHLAAHIPPNHEYKDIQEIVASNIAFGSHLLECMTQFGCTALINTGSFFETSQSSEYEPYNFYAVSKFCFQKIIDFYVARNRIKAITLRLMDTYGPDDPRKRLWPRLLNSLKNGMPLDVSKGQQLLDLVHIDDIINAYISAWQLFETMDFEHKIYYVARNEKRTLKNVVEIFEKIANQKFPINWGALPYREREIMDPFIGETLPNWEAKIDLEEGFRSLLHSDKVLA